jgi:hypothetical protein
VKRRRVRYAIANAVECPGSELKLDPVY